MGWNCELFLFNPSLLPFFETISDLSYSNCCLGSSQKFHDFVKSLQKNVLSTESYEDFLRLGVEKLIPTYYSNESSAFRIK